MQKYKLEILIALCIIICGFSIYSYYITFYKFGLSLDTTNWAEFGNYIGGVTSSIFGFVSVILIQLTFRNQNDNFNLQQFETTFFNLLSNQREILNSLSGYVYEDWSDGRDLLEGKDTHPEGRKYIDSLSLELEKYIKNKHKAVRTKLEYEAEIQKMYDFIYNSREAQLGHYFRHLYHILKYTHESKINNKRKYIDLIQAQMSDNELFISFYNGISKYGKDKFLPLMDEYGFLENIKSRSTLFDKHKITFYPKTVFKNMFEIK